MSITGVESAVFPYSSRKGEDAGLNDGVPLLSKKPPRAAQNAAKATRKSLSRMNTAEETYALIAARPTPSAPPSAVNP